MFALIKKYFLEYFSVDFIKLLQEKCFHYWPNETDSNHYGKFEVVRMNETHLSDWSITEFCISLVSVMILSSLLLMNILIALRIEHLEKTTYNNECFLTTYYENMDRVH